MKTYLYTLALLLMAPLAFGQSIDENGRTAEARAVQIQNLQPVAPVLQQKPSDKNAQVVIVEFAFPNQKTAGELRVFHPREDKELAVFGLAGATGQVKIPLTSLVNGTGVVGLYSEGKFLHSLNVRYE
jgi:hypothetical protein